MARMQLDQIRCDTTSSGGPEHTSIIIAVDTPALILYEASPTFTNGYVFDIGQMFAYQQQIRIHLYENKPGNVFVHFGPAVISSQALPTNSDVVAELFQSTLGLPGRYEIIYRILPEAPGAGPAPLPVPQPIPPPVFQPAPQPAPQPVPPPVFQPAPQPAPQPVPPPVFQPVVPRPPSTDQLNRVGQALVEAISATVTSLPIGDEGAITADTVQFNPGNNTIHFHITVHYKQSSGVPFLGSLYDFTTFYDGNIDLHDPLESIKQTQYGFDLPGFPELGIDPTSVSLNAAQLVSLGETIAEILA